MRAEYAPDGATKATHPHERGISKVAMLGMNYGMGVRSLAAGTGLSPIHAARLHQQLKRTYEVFGQWSRRVVDTALLRGEISTVCGWRAGVVEGTKVTTLTISRTCAGSPPPPRGGAGSTCAVTPTPFPTITARPGGVCLTALSVFSAQ